MWRAAEVAYGRRYAHSRNSVWRKRSAFPLVRGVYGRAARRRGARPLRGTGTPRGAVRDSPPGANDVLERRIEDLVTRPRGRPSHAPLVRYRSFQYQPASWDRPRRVLAKVEHHLGELFPRLGFIVTTLTGTNPAVVRFYDQRGTAGQWIKEGKEATRWTRLSCHRFRANEVRLLLGVIAYTSAISCVGWSCPSPSRVGR